MRIETHFDAVHPRDILQALDKRLRGKTQQERLHTLRIGLRDGMMAPPSNLSVASYLKSLREVTCYLMLWTAERSRTMPFSDMRRDREFLAYLNFLGASEMQVNVNARLFWHAARYYLNGSRTYQVDGNLAELLRHTELVGLKGADLHLPYRSIYMHVPPESGLRVWNPDTQWHRLAGVYLTIEDGFDNFDGRYADLNDLPCRTLRALVIGEWEMKPVTEGFEMPDDALLYWSVPLVDDWSLDRCIRHHKDTARDYAGRLPVSYINMREEWDLIFTWLVNVVMYATSHQCRADLQAFDPRAQQLRNRIAKAKNPKRRKAHAAELNRMDQRRYTILGRGVPSLSAGRGTGTPLTKRTLVQGHWRNQAVGPRWSERRRILIEPFWRGPEDAEEQAVPHRLAT